MPNTTWLKWREISWTYEVWHIKISYKNFNSVFMKIIRFTNYVTKLRPSGLGLFRLQQCNSRLIKTLNVCIDDKDMLNSWKIKTQVDIYFIICNHLEPIYVTNFPELVTNISCVEWLSFLLRICPMAWHLILLDTFIISIFLI